MIYEPLDTTSEKILKLFTEHRVLTVHQISTKLNTEWFVAGDHVQILLAEGFLGPYSLNTFNSSTILPESTYIITTKGDIYFDLKRKHKIEFYRNSIIIPIAITLLTNLLTSLLTK